MQAYGHEKMYRLGLIGNTKKCQTTTFVTLVPVAQALLKGLTVVDLVKDPAPKGSLTRSTTPKLGDDQALASGELFEVLQYAEHASGSE